jgi:hypothetical protein
MNGDEVRAALADIELLADDLRRLLEAIERGDVYALMQDGWRVEAIRRARDGESGQRALRGYRGKE